MSNQFELLPCGSLRREFPFAGARCSTLQEALQQRSAANQRGRRTPASAHGLFADQVAVSQTRLYCSAPSTGKAMPLNGKGFKGRKPSKLGLRTHPFEAKQTGLANPKLGGSFAGRLEPTGKSTRQRTQFDLPPNRVCFSGSLRVLSVDGDSSR